MPGESTNILNDGDSVVVGSAPNSASALAGPSMFTGAQNVLIQGGTFTAVGRDHIVSQTVNITMHSDKRDDEDLDCLPPSQYENIHRQVYESRAPKTGEAFLQRQKYMDWIDGKFKVLCATGMPGAGKTHQAAMVINDLLHQAAKVTDTMVTYSYIRYSHTETTSTGVVSGMLRQIAKRDASAAKAITAVFKQHKRDKTDPTLGELVDLLKSVLANYRRRQLVFDGFDEAPEEVQVEITEIASSLDASILVFSRPSETLQSGLPEAEFTEVSAEPHDLEILIDRQISRFHKLRALLQKYNVREEVVSTIVSKASGMFLHAFLQIECIRDCMSLKQLRAKLAQFPVKIKDMYATTFRRIEGQSEENAELAKRILIWVLFAARPLSLAELQAALAVHPESLELDTDSIDIENALGELCCGLVYYEKETNLVRLVHLTAKEILPALLEKDYPDPHALAGLCCIAYLDAQVTHNYDISYSKQNSDFSCEALPLLLYSTDHAATHLQMAGWDRISSIVTSFVLKHERFNHPSLPRLISTGTTGPPPEHMKTLHIATVLGLLPLVVKLLEDPEHHVNVNCLTEPRRWTPLLLASHQGFEDIVKYLLTHPDIDVNFPNYLTQSPLILACKLGRTRIVQLLLDHPRVDPSFISNAGSTAVFAACDSNLSHEIIPMFLARQDVDIAYRSPSGTSALSIAAGKGNAKTVRLLLALPGVEANTQNLIGMTPLMQASLRGRRDVIQAFLEHPGIQVNLADQYEMTALMYACAGGHHEVAACLVAFPETDVLLKDNEGHTALTHACHLVVQYIVGVFQFSEMYVDVVQFPLPCGQEDREVLSYMMTTYTSNGLKTIQVVLDSPKLRESLGVRFGSSALEYVLEEYAEQLTSCLREFSHVLQGK